MLFTLEGNLFHINMLRFLMFLLVCATQIFCASANEKYKEALLAPESITVKSYIVDYHVSVEVVMLGRVSGINILYDFRSPLKENLIEGVDAIEKGSWRISIPKDHIKDIKEIDFNSVKVYTGRGNLCRIDFAYTSINGKNMKSRVIIEMARKKYLMYIRWDNSGEIEQVFPDDSDEWYKEPLENKRNLIPYRLPPNKTKTNPPKKISN